MIGASIMHGIVHSLGVSSRDTMITTPAQFARMYCNERNSYYYSQAARASG